MISCSRRAGLRIWLVAFFCFESASTFAAIKQDPIPELRPPRDELLTKTNSKDVLPWYIASGAAAALAVFILLRSPKIPREAVSESPYARASRELAAATTVDAISYTVLSYTLAAFPLPGRGQTPAELLAFLAQHPRFTTELSERLAQFFAPMEVVKFAPLAPTPAMEKLVTQAAQILASLETLRTGT